MGLSQVCPFKWAFCQESFWKFWHQAQLLKIFGRLLKGEELLDDYSDPDDPLQSS